MLATGLPLAAWIGLTWFSLAWNLPGAAIAGLLPGWFALGVLRPGLVPGWFPLDRPRIGWALIVVIVVSIAGLSVTGAYGSPPGGSFARAVDPPGEFAAIAPFPSYASPAFEIASAEDASFEPAGGHGPMRWMMTWRLRNAEAAAPFGEVRIEVWAGPAAHGNSPLTQGELVLARTLPMSARGTRTIEVPVAPERELYYLAIVGVRTDGSRELLGWPEVRPWQWSGTPLDYFAATVGR